jgi:hypothetical protein
MNVKYEKKNTSNTSHSTNLEQQLPRKGSSLKQFEGQKSE